MNPKERVLTALEHREPDRVPIDYAATPETDKNLRDFLGLNTQDDLLEYFKVDFRYIEPVCKLDTVGSFFGDPLIKDLGNGTYEDIWGVKFKKVDYELGEYFDYVESPLAHIQNEKELDRFEIPDVHSIWDFSTLKNDAEKYKDYAVVFNGAVLLQFCQALRGMQGLMMDLSSNPNLATEILRRVVDYWIELGTSILRYADGLIDIFVINDDYGMQKGPLFNPNIWRKHLKPLIHKAIKAYKQYDVKIMFHSCGSITPFIPDLIEMGVDILDPVQVAAKSMVPGELKKTYGEDICFRGAIDTQKLLPYGTPEEVKQTVRKTLKEMGQNGGYICTSVHNIQPDVPFENIFALYEGAIEFGKYPIQ